MTAPTPEPEAELEMPSEIAMARVAALFGGVEAVVRASEQRRSEFMAVWDRDSADLGRVLHAHLVVEYFLTEYLKHMHPTLDLDRLRLRYEQKVGMLPGSNTLLGTMKPGLGALGSIRNRIAHVRQVQISKDDVQAIVNVKFYAELMRAGGVIDFSKAEPLDVVLNFAQWAASTLHSGTDPANEKWTVAFDPKVPVPGFEAFLPKHPREGFGGVGRPSRSG